MIEPRGCIEMGCPFLYTYEDQSGGHRYMGCLQKVFAVEIDVDMFEKAERTRAGFGGIKASREPLAMCPFKVERSYEGQGGAFTCTNPPAKGGCSPGPGSGNRIAAQLRLETVDRHEKGKATENGIEGDDRLHP